MSRPSEPLLSWLRELIRKRGLNTAAVADRAKLPRARVRQLLAGTEPMLVDELMRLSEALSIAPSDMGLPDPGEDGPVGPPLPLPPEPPDPFDAFGNHPEQIFRMAFGLGIDFFFLCDAAELGDSGVPGHVLNQYKGRELPIKLDAAYHSYNDPRYSPLGLTLTLSFDQLYECTFPWKAVKQFILFPLAPVAPAEPDPEGGDDDSDEDEPPSKGVPHLRLVK